MAGTRDGGEPRYVQVATDLRAALARGDFADGDQLPTETALCTRYGVSRFTVREALRRLQAEGLIRRRRGSGTVVDRSGGHALRQPLGDVAELLQYAAGSTFGIERHGIVTLGAARAAITGLPASSRWSLLTGLRTMAGQAAPIAVTDVFIHADLAACVPGLRGGSEALFRQLERLGGFTIARVAQDIQAVAAGAREATALHLPRRTPCLRIIRAYLDGDGRTVEVSVSTHPGEAFTYSMHIDH